MARIYNQRHGDAPVGAIYVGRGKSSPYGNPFTSLNKEATLAKFQAASVAESIELFSKWFIQEHGNGVLANAKEFLTPLIGKDLICWCAPKGGIEHITRPLICHGQVLASYAEAAAMLG